MQAVTTQQFLHGDCTGTEFSLVTAEFKGTERDPAGGHAAS